MNLKPEIVASQDELTAIRRDIHMHPETAFEEHRTADIVAEKLESWGIDVHRGLAKTGVVGTLKAGTANRAIGLRADLDALDLHELNDFDHKSKYEGKMHGCGHDGHTVMLLGAAKYLAETKNFDGTVQFIFQPAEENVAGGRVMISDGLFEKFPVEEVYGMHNMPGFELGKFAMRKGPVMASADFFELTITGVGGHGAYPHKAVDPVLLAAQVILAWQGIVSRNTDPVEASVISVTEMKGGHTTNVIPESVVLRGTTRSFLPEIQKMIETNMEKIARGIVESQGGTMEFIYDPRYASTINTPEQTDKAAKAARAIVGAENVDTHTPQMMGAEDFSWMLRERPGCYLFIGNDGPDGGCHVHNPNYDFNDGNLTIGASFWAELVEQELPAERVSEAAE
ncbi:M20 aminoacylase family protein [Rhodovibrionaceae bacterium A322]